MYSWEIYIIKWEGVCSLMFIVIGDGQGDPSSSPRQGGLHFTLH